MFSFFSENDLILPKQSGIRPDNSCTDQLLYSVRKIGGYEVMGVLHEISKEFDRDLVKIYNKSSNKF